MQSRFKVILTREEEDVKKDSLLFEKEGFEVVSLPLIRTRELPFTLEKISYDYVVFQSKKAAKYFFRRIKSLPSSVRIVAVGKKTKKYLSELGFEDVLVPERESALGLVELFRELPKGRVLIPRSAVGRTELIEFLEKEGFELTVLNIYTTHAVEYPPSEFRQKLRGDFILFYSPSAVKSFFANLQRAEIPLEDLRLIFVAVGETTKEELLQRGVKGVYTPEKPSAEALVGLLKKLARNL